MSILGGGIFKGMAVTLRNFLGSYTNKKKRLPTIDYSWRADRGLECCCDAALVPTPVYSVLMTYGGTYGGASVLHCTKKIGPAVASTHDAVRTSVL